VKDISKLLEQLEKEHKKYVPIGNLLFEVIDMLREIGAVEDIDKFLFPYTIDYPFAVTLVRRFYISMFVTKHKLILIDSCGNIDD
jgi:hypothetical protein